MAFPQSSSQPYYLSIYDPEIKPIGKRSTKHFLVFVIIVAIIVIIITIILLAIRKPTCAVDTDCSSIQTCTNGYCS